MKKRLFNTFICIILTLSVLCPCIYAEEAPVPYCGVYFSFTDYPEIVLENSNLKATVTVTWSDSPVTGIAQWYWNGMPIEGWCNEAFVAQTGVTSKLNYNIPRWETMPLEGWIGFALTVDGKTTFIDVPVKVENHPYSYYHPEEAERVLSQIKHVYVDATLLRGTTAYSNYRLKNECGWIPAGTKVKYIDYYDIKKGKQNIHYSAQLLLENGNTCWVEHNSISISKKNYTVYTDHTPQDKVAFVNAMDYESVTDYLVWINLERQKINVFRGSKGRWELYGVFPCATGKNSTPTIDGVFKYSKYTPYWDFDEYYVKYVLIFNGGHAFHSRTYRTSTKKLLDETIGTTTSLGCVRMYDEDVIWLRDNLPLYSTVVVY